LPAGTTCGCGGRWETAKLPKRLGDRIVIEEWLGAGGQGFVYRAIDEVLQRSIAVKTLPALSRDAAERLTAEARAMASLSHPHIAVLYGSETWRGTPALLMEYCAGGTLAGQLRRAPLTPHLALRMTLDLANALGYLHTAGRSHGDIKPSNIGLTADGTAKLLDFGLSQVRETSIDIHGGTLPYLSPEALRGEPVGPALDLWALSVVLLESITGVHPFLDARGTESRILRGFDGRVGRAREPLPPSFDHFFRIALAPVSSHRPPDAAAFIIQLRTLHDL
jgi:serine/threonine-protein kinase